jgi:hypothetical protein
VSTPPWRQLGFLTPDAFESQQEVWALSARLRGALADVLGDLGARTAEPTWGATLQHGATRARALADELLLQAGEDALVRVGEDDLVRAFDSSLGEVLASEHVPALIATGYAVLGELGTLPVRLLEDVAGPHSRPLCARLLAEDDHRVLGRLLPVTQPPPREQESLRRMLRHLHQQLFAVYQGWRQTLHTLGVDGETLAEQAQHTVQSALQMLELPSTAADVRFLKS